MNTIEITLRSVQHYLYCPHRWGLLEIDRAWAENVFVTRANLLHERVHDPEKNYTARGKKVFTSVPVYNDREEYNLYGVVDSLELTEDPQGVPIKGSGKKYKICIVEYKPTKPKDREYRDDDLMQVFAQKVCVDYVFGGDCDAVLYYADVRRRVPLPLREFFEDYDRKLKDTLFKMREYFVAGQIPSIQKGQKCTGCSMKDLCMPAVRKEKSFREELHTLIAMEQDI